MIEKNSNKYFNLHRGCFVEIGKENGAIYDLYKKEIYVIDLQLAKLLRLSERKKIPIQGLIKANNGEKQKREIIRHLNNLAKRGLGYFSDKYIVACKMRPDETLSNLFNKYICWPLKKIYLELVNECNLNCCQFFNKNGPCFRCSCTKSPSISTKNNVGFTISRSNWITMIEDANLLGCKEIHFIGGDPLLTQDLLFNLILFIREIMPQKTRIIVHTNLSLINEDIASFFSKNRVEVNFNIYSHKPAVHDAITMTRNSWHVMIESISILSKCKVVMNPTMEILKQNENDIVATNKLLKKYGLKTSINLSIILTTEALIASKYIGDMYVTSLIEPPNREKYFLSKESHSCWRGTLAVTATGYVLPCFAARTEIIGNVLQTRFKDFIVERLIEKWWMCSKDHIEFCKNCELRYARFDCRPAQSSDGTVYGLPSWCPKQNVKIN